MIKTVLLLFVVGAAAFPTYVDCDLKLSKPGSNRLGENIMTITPIMSVDPVVATGLTFPTEVEAGASVDLTFPADIGGGFVHVSSGVLAKPENFDSPCDNMVRSLQAGTLNEQTVQFTAPSAAGDVTLSIAYSVGFSQTVARFSQTITVKAASSGGSGSDSSTGGSGSDSSTGSDSPSESTGSDSTGSDTPSESTGSDTPSESTGSDSPGSDSTGSDSTGSAEQSAAVGPKLGLATLAASLSFLL